MQITEVRISLRDEERLKAFANVTFDDEFVVRGLKVIEGDSGRFVSMPSRKRPDGSHQDIAHPINSGMRERLEEAVLGAYRREQETGERGDAGGPGSSGA
ncbi:MAG: septation regulator SpoVG [bacterium]